MLSRVAQRVYWLGRYMERAENTARIINVNSNLLFDLPRGTRIGWRTLVQIVGNETDFSSRHASDDERSVMRYLLADQSNPCSIIYSLLMARENARTTREILPTEAWERVNDLYLFVKDSLIDGLGRKNRYYLLQEVIANSQQLTGLLSGTMSNNNAYDFIRIGRNLERADMSTRMLDIGCLNLLPHLLENQQESETVDLYQSILWMDILISISAHQMYHQHIQNRVNGTQVVEFILTDTEFPRAVLHCLNQVQACLQKLPKGAQIANIIHDIKGEIQRANIQRLIDKGLHEFIDRLQIEFARLNNQIESKWFLE